MSIQPSATEVKIAAIVATASNESEQEVIVQRCSTRSPSECAEPIIEKWQWSGHTWINQQVVRQFGDHKVGGEVTSWLPASGDDPALFHVVHEDGERG